MKVTKVLGGVAGVLAVGAAFYSLGRQAEGEEMSAAETARIGQGAYTNPLACPFIVNRHQLALKSAQQAGGLAVLATVLWMWR